MRDLIIELLIALAMLCVLYWAVGALPLPAMIAQVAVVVLIVVFCLWLIDIVAGLMGGRRVIKRQ